MVERVKKLLDNIFLAVASCIVLLWLATTDGSVVHLALDHFTGQTEASEAEGTNE